MSWFKRFLPPQGSAPRGPSHLFYNRTDHFASAVKKSGGRAILLMHPYFGPADARYFQTMEKMKQRSPLPIIVLEERRSMEASLKKYGESPAFWVHTLDSKPEPVGGWKRFNAELRKAGVHTVLIGGMNSDAHGNQEDSEMLDLYEKIHLAQPVSNMPRSQCVAGAYRNLIAGGIRNVRLLPALVFPDRPKIESRQQGVERHFNSAIARFLGRRG